MIPRRYAWMLRDEGVCFDTNYGFGHGCRLCSALERPTPRMQKRALPSHLAAHRREKVTSEPRQPELLEDVAE